MRAIHAARLAALRVVITLTATGCASAPLHRDDMRASLAPPVACQDQAARTTGGEMLLAAVQNGIPATVYLILRGAGEGAFWGAITGGNAGHGAWIGAAVGAGLGLGIGAIEGTARGFEIRRRYADAIALCRTVPPDEYIEQPRAEADSSRASESPPPPGAR
jgi:hypothetical protein